MDARWADELVEVDGTAVHLRTAGPVRSRRTALVLHDAGAESVDAPAWAALATSRRVVQVLLPGVGRSDPPPRPLTIAWTTRLLAGVVDALGDGPVVAAGTSLGGWFAVELALAHPDRVARLLLLDCAGLHTPPGYLLALFADGQGTGGHDGLIGPLMAAHGADLHGSGTPAAAAPYLAGLSAVALRSWSAHAPDPSLLVRARDVAVPGVVLWGAADALIPVAHGRALAAAIGCPLHVVADAGHLLAVDAPHVVVGHLDALDLGSAPPCPSTSTA